MEQRPLPEDVTRAARTYLATLVPTGEVSNAWHELLEDVTYWRETARIPVLHLAHQVVLQHERVTPDVATLALTELGVTDPADVATILDVDRATAGDLLAHIAASQDVDVVDLSGVEPTPVTTVQDRAPQPAPDPAPDVAPDPARHPAPAARSDMSSTDPSPTAVRIGFDEDEAHDLHHRARDGGGSWFTTRRLLVLAVVVWTLILLAWALGGIR